MRRAPEAADELSFIPDDGETGALVRSIDWSKNPLGPPAGWSPTLKTVLGVLFRSRHPMFLWWGPELIQFYNDAYRPSFGRGKHPGAMGQRGDECWPEIWPIIGPQIRDVMERGKASWNENQLVPIHRNGRLEDVYWTYGYSPVSEPDGRIAGTLVVCTETTETVLTRMEAQSAHKDAERARAELHGIFMQAPLPMCILTGPEHRFLLANARYLELVGREVLGRTVHEVFTYEELGYYLPYLDRVYRSREAVQLREAPLRLTNARGQLEERFLDVVYHPYTTATGACGVLGIAQDITAQVLARRRLEELAAVREAEVQARDEFLSIASHELRTPLTGLSLHIQSAKRALLRNDPDAFEPERITRLIHRTDRSLNKFTHLLEEVLDLSRIRSGKLQLHRELFDLAELVRDSLERFASELDSAAIAVHFEAIEAVRVEADRTRLEQVATNLISNAIRYAAGAPIRVRVDRVGDRARLLFQDGGPGIPKDGHARVFERFQRLHSDRNRSGLGIGLYIVREIVVAHGGTIVLRSDPGEGAEFTVELPARAN